MSKIKVSELFYSIQGEGRYMGVPSIFLRTFGCNFTCDGFGMPRGDKSVERVHVSFAHQNTPYKDYKELPLVSTGCDSYASWMPAFKELSPMLNTDAIVDKMMEILPYNQWRDEHLVITGGEPLLGWQKQYPDLLNHLKMHGLKEITFETNGTQKLTPEFKLALKEWSKWYNREITFSVSAKLPVSGEKWEEAILPEVVCEYEKVGYTYLKFVIASEEDAKDAEAAVNEYRKVGFKGPVYLMPVGGTIEKYQMNTKAVAEYAMAKGWRYSARLQCDIFRNEWGT